MSHDENSVKLMEAAGRLTAKGLLQAGDTLSMRLAGQDAVLLLTAGEGASSLDIVVLPAGAPVADECCDGSALSLHLAAYRLRADVGTVLLNRQPWARSLYELGDDMPGVFDEQIRHLGRRVARLEDGLASRAGRARLGSGCNAFVLPNRVLCLGMMMDRAIFNAELLEKCAKAYVLASCTGMKAGKIPWLVRWIANGRLMKDERNAARQFARGQTPVFSSAY